MAGHSRRTPHSDVDILVEFAPGRKMFHNSAAECLRHILDEIAYLGFGSGHTTSLPNLAVNMKKRLRKKLRKREFLEFGFEVRFRFRRGLTEQEQDALIDAFLEEAVEAQDLGFGGGGRDEWSGYVAKMGRRTATEQNRIEMKRWLSSRSEIVEHDVGVLTDAWYGV